MLTRDEKEAILKGEAAATSLKQLGLRGRGEVFLSNTTCARLIDRSSRVLRKDAEAFVALLETASAHTGRDLVGQGRHRSRGEGPVDLGRETTWSG